MKILLILLAIVFLGISCSGNNLKKTSFVDERGLEFSEPPSNPWLASEHKADKNGFLHDFPCHAGEAANMNFGKGDSPSGCYVLDWGEVEPNCYVDEQNVKICNNL